ncbi:hypothetical protein [Caulobacter mirabilis]|uniref:Lipid/polyisoprenoid-binding YceI-like domain-containing protein n=1 Tax=Caulobacter mirabilis TaxID=69666 RepID=A0A2D2AZL5_9CAUL|nr:hypothetical protein [Caulobacter mirabilis]ATQ43434.1 hypothetical protein CSW64_13945 [Caulobacter mirabilis]
MRPVLVALAVSALALTAACNRKSETAEAPAPAAAPPPAPVAPEPAVEAPGGFQHQAKFDASGYYMAENIQTGAYRLNHIAIGAPSDFSQWEQGKRASVFGPILFQFDDLNSPTVTNEMGGEAHAVTVRLLPEAYSVAPGKMTFKGSDPKLGQVLFSGTFDEAALAQAKAEGASTGPVLRGVLKVGNAPARPVALNYFVGE